MTKVKLHSLSWYKQSTFSEKISFDADYTYNVEGIGEIKTKITIPVSLAEQLDAIGQRSLWEKIDKVR